MLEKIGSRGTCFVVELESAVKEVHGIRRDVCRDCRFCTHTDLELPLSVCDAKPTIRREFTLKIACIWDKCGHGCSPVSISTTKQPTLQISALNVYAFCWTTSGAIQNTEP